MMDASNVGAAIAIAIGCVAVGFLAVLYLVRWGIRQIDEHDDWNMQ